MNSLLFLVFFWHEFSLAILRNRLPILLSFICRARHLFLADQGDRVRVGDQIRVGARLESLKWVDGFYNCSLKSAELSGTFDKKMNR